MEADIVGKQRWHVTMSLLGFCVGGDMTMGIFQAEQPVCVNTCCACGRDFW